MMPPGHPECHGTGSSCYAYARKKHLPCNVCNVFPPSGTVSLPLNFPSPMPLTPSMIAFLIDSHQRGHLWDSDGASQVRSVRPHDFS